MEETRTRFCAAMPASLNASSNEVRRSLCLPTPLVRKMRFGTMSMPNVVVLRKLAGLIEPQKITYATAARGEFQGNFLAARVERPAPAAALVARQQGRFRPGRGLRRIVKGGSACAGRIWRTAYPRAFSGCLIFTATSINASAARLNALSL